MDRQNPQFQLAAQVCEALQKQGYQAWLAGGCVRDLLLHRVPADFDVATSATPDQVEGLFPKTLAVGKAFGVIIVVDAQSSENQVEVATFRKDGSYQDGRRPDSVEFSEAAEDAKRRDFTVNALFYDLQKQQIVDYVGGQEDLKKQILRAVGEPALRFREDHLRLLRAVRFRSQLGFEIEKKTFQAVKDAAALISTVSGERVQDELTKLLKGHWIEEGLKSLFESHLLSALIGEALLTWQEPHPIFSRRDGSKEDAWFRFFLWIHQMHPKGTSASFFEQLCDRWKFSRDLRGKTLKALHWIYEDRPFLRHPLGELLAFSFEKEHERGLIESSEFYLQSDDEKIGFERFLKRRLELGRDKPEPWVKASDFAGKLQGEALGQALRLCYWEQLEGNAAHKEDLLKMWESRRD